MKSYDDRFMDWYDANKEALSTMGEEEKISRAFEAGWSDCDQLVPPVVSWLLAMSQQYNVAFAPFNDGWGLGIGEEGRWSKSPMSLISQFAAELLDRGSDQTDTPELIVEEPKNV